MSTPAKWVVIILLLLASASFPFLMVTRDQIGSEGYTVWIMLVAYAYVPAMVAKNRPVWSWAVMALCVVSVASFAISLITDVVTHEFEVWVSLAGWANFLSWALAIGSRFAGRCGRMEISGFGRSSPHSGSPS